MSGSQLDLGKEMLKLNSRISVLKQFLSFIDMHVPLFSSIQDEDLSFETIPCTAVRTGMVRSTEGQKFLSLCLNNQWKPYYPLGSPVKGCYNNRIPGLIGHWRMNEQTGDEVADDSGYENHGSADVPVPKLSKFTRGRHFDSSGLISVPNSPVLNLGVSSFTVTGWTKILDVTYPLTTFAVQKGGCYYPPGHSGVKAGWEIGHGYNAKGLDVCIRDKEFRMTRKNIEFDDDFQQHHLLDQWVHYAVVFDRQQQKKVFLYINGKKQSKYLDISAVQGSVDNTRPLIFGYLYGWKTKGTLDEYRVYNKALDDFEVGAIFKNHLV